MTTYFRMKHVRYQEQGAKCIARLQKAEAARRRNSQENY
jgi:hypothetical protein